MRAASRRHATAIILAPAGADAEGAARAIHAGSARASGPFVRVAAANLDLSRGIEIAAAEGGVLFLPDIEAIPMPQQARLAAFLDERRIAPAGGAAVRADVRVIASTTDDPSRLLRLARLDGEFYFRIAAHPVRVPPLAERPEDVPMLVEHRLVERARAGLRAPRCAPGALSALAARRWANDVAELRSAVDRLADSATGGSIEVADVAALTRMAPPAASTPCLPALRPRLEGPCDLDTILGETERGYIIAALERTNGVVAESARLLGLRRTTLIDRMRRHGLTRAETGRAADPWRAAA